MGLRCIKHDAAAPRTRRWLQHELRPSGALPTKLHQSLSQLIDVVGHEAPWPPDSASEGREHSAQARAVTGTDVRVEPGLGRVQGHEPVILGVPNHRHVEGRGFLRDLRKPVHRIEHHITGAGQLRQDLPADCQGRIVGGAGSFEPRVEPHGLIGDQSVRLAPAAPELLDLGQQRERNEVHPRPHRGKAPRRPLGELRPDPRAGAGPPPEEDGRPRLAKERPVQAVLRVVQGGQGAHRQRLGLEMRGRVALDGAATGAGGGVLHG
mmetsp:Transcript_91831/g.239432  ORF Transcript_91831/g.239432 Transcript_91831/m.239432 type:complete len:265 (-) Transcript_91831:55-849(-)